MQASLARLRERREEETESGFTLIELLIVIVILGILAAIVVFAVGAVTGKSANAACQSDFKTVQVAEEAYKAQMGTYIALAAGSTANPLTTTAVDPQGFTVGPWMKSNVNSSHYNIAADASGDIAVGVGSTPANATATSPTDAKTACQSITG